MLDRASAALDTAWREDPSRALVAPKPAAPALAAAEVEPLICPAVAGAEADVWPNLGANVQALPRARQRQAPVRIVQKALSNGRAIAADQRTGILPRREISAQQLSGGARIRDDLHHRQCPCSLLRLHCTQSPVLLRRTAGIARHRLDECGVLGGAGSLYREAGAAGPLWSQDHHAVSSQSTGSTERRCDGLQRRERLSARNSRAGSQQEPPYSKESA